MTFDGAVVREQGVTFALAIVKSYVLNSPSDCADAQRGFRQVFPGLPVVLVAQDSRGTPTYFGRRDIVDFMARVPMSAVQWKRYNA